MSYHHLSVATEYLIDSPSINWLKEDWMTAVWIAAVIVYGLVQAGLFFGAFMGFLEFLKIWPVNTLESIFSGDTSAPSPIGMEGTVETTTA